MRTYLLLACMIAAFSLSWSGHAVAQDSLGKTVTRESLKRFGAPGKILGLYNYKDGRSLGYLLQDFVSGQPSLSYYRYDFKQEQNIRLVTSLMGPVEQSERGEFEIKATANERHLFWIADNFNALIYHVDLEHDRVDSIACGHATPQRPIFSADESFALIVCSRGEFSNGVIHRISLRDGIAAEPIPYARYVGYDAAKNLLYLAIDEPGASQPAKSTLVAMDPVTRKSRLIAVLTPGLDYELIPSTDQSSVVVRSYGTDDPGQWLMLDGSASTTLADCGRGNGGSIAFLDASSLACVSTHRNFIKVLRPTAPEQEPVTSLLHQPPDDYYESLSVTAVGPSMPLLTWYGCTDKTCGKEWHESLGLGGSPGECPSRQKDSWKGPFLLLSLRSKSARFFTCESNIYADVAGHLTYVAYDGLFGAFGHAEPTTDWISYVDEFPKISSYGEGWFLYSTDGNGWFRTSDLNYYVHYRGVRAGKPLLISVDWGQGTQGNITGRVIGDGKWFVVMYDDSLYAIDAKTIK